MDMKGGCGLFLMYYPDCYTMMLGCCEGRKRGGGGGGTEHYEVIVGTPTSD
jgi:hypothetical protein